MGLLDDAHSYSYPRNMDCQKLVTDLSAAGLSQGEIAKAIGVSQPNVSDMSRGKIKSPSWHVGDALLKLHRKVMRRAARVSA